MIVFRDQQRFVEAEIKTEKLLEEDVIQNAKVFFGKNSIYIDTKRKLDSKNLGDTIPDGFLFDLSEKDNPAFYIVEVELAKHDFYGHIFPQFTKFFGFYKISNKRGDLVDKLFSTINNDDDLKKEFKKHLQEKEIYKFIKDLINESQNILLLIDGDKPELYDVMDTYSDTWGKMVKRIILKKFVSNSDVIFTMDPEFENIDYSYVTQVSQNPNVVATSYDEQYHLKGVNDDIAAMYMLTKDTILKLNGNVNFNPRKYYIAMALDRNLAFFQFSKKKIRLVVMKEESYVRSKLKHYNIKHLTESVQKFWNGNCCEIELTNADNITEVIDILKELVTSSST